MGSPSSPRIAISARLPGPASGKATAASNWNRPLMTSSNPNNGQGSQRVLRPDQNQNPHPHAHTPKNTHTHASTGRSLLTA